MAELKNKCIYWSHDVTSFQYFIGDKTESGNFTCLLCRYVDQDRQDSWNIY